MPYPVTQGARLQCVSVNIHWTSRWYSFSRLLNPDWSIQTFGAPTICKAARSRMYFLFAVSCAVNLFCQYTWGKSFRGHFPLNCWVQLFRSSNTMVRKLKGSGFDLISTHCSCSSCLFTKRYRRFSTLKCCCSR